MKHLQKITLLALIIIFSLACDQQKTAPQTSASTDQLPRQGQAFIKDNASENNILNIAIGSKDHTTLVAAVQAASMENVLVNAGPLTVFAPTNAAFDKLPPGTVEDLLKPENKEVLANIITFHAAPGTYNESNIKGVMGIGQATGDKVKVTVNEAGETFVNGAKVLASIKASNGYVHVIDQVLLPPEN